jgi:tetratricopeptide (TPR) repeat protein
VRAALPAVAAARVPIFSFLRLAAMELALNPGKGAAEYQRGLLYAEEALRLRPDDPEIHGSLGALLFRLGRDDARAIAALERAARDDAVPVALPFLVALHARRGAKAEAAAAARRLAVWVPKLQDEYSSRLKRAFDQFRREYLAHVPPVAASRPTAVAATGATAEQITRLNQLVETAARHRRPQLLTERAALRVRSRDWAGALADCEEAWRLAPADGDWPRYRAGALHAYLGDRAGLAAVVGQMQLDVWRSVGPEFRERALKLGLLLRPTAPAPEELSRLVEAFTSRSEGDTEFAAWGWTTLALAEVRSGRPAGALERLGHAREARGFPGQPSLQSLAASIEALALDALGRHDPAGQALAQARLLLDGPSPSGEQEWASRLGDDWQDWLIARVVYREAQARVVYDRIFPADPFAR